MYTRATATAAAVAAGSIAYLAILQHWFFKSHPSIQIEHAEAKKEVNVNFVTLTATPCVTEKMVHHGLPCLQEDKYTLVPVTGKAVANEPMFRVMGVASLNEFEKACETCRVQTEISYKNEFGVLVTKRIPWTHSVSRTAKDINHVFK
jgi:hypothetical protein